MSATDNPRDKSGARGQYQGQDEESKKAQESREPGQWRKTTEKERKPGEPAQNPQGIFQGQRNFQGDLGNMKTENRAINKNDAAE